MYTREEVYNETLKYFKGDELATNVFFKYCLSDKDGNYLELTPDDMHHRLAKELHRIELKYPNPLSYEEIYNSLKNFERIVPQGSPMFGIGNDEQNISLSNCVVIDSPADNISSIFDAAKNLANLAKRRCGVGCDLSELRPENALTNNSAKSSTGAWSFADFYSYVTRMIAMRGRRAALLLSMDIRHPDIDKFITCKEDLTKVTGANISVKNRDEFMKAVENDEDYTLRWPVVSEVKDAKYTKVVKARELWNLLVETATLTADPGLLFWDKITSYMPSESYKVVNDAFRTRTTNPCFSYDTLIAVADGRNAVPIGDLAKEGLDIPVYAVDHNSGKVEIKMGRNPRVTGENQTLYRVTLDDGSHLDVTENHKFPLMNGTVKETKKLTMGDSLCRFTKIAEHITQKNPSQYYRVYCDIFNSKKSKTYEHRLVTRFYNKDLWDKIYDENKQNGWMKGGLVIHHKDYNSLNNKIDNLEIMTFRDHQKLHSSVDTQGEKNGRYSGFTNEDIEKHAIHLTKTLERRFSTKEWDKYAKKHGLPMGFTDWRSENWFNTPKNLSNWAAIQCGYGEFVDVDPRVVKTYQNSIKQGYEAKINNDQVFIQKSCEECKDKFWIAYGNREVSFCGAHCVNIHNRKHHGEQMREGINRHYAKQQEETKKKQIDVYLNLKILLNRPPLRSEWEKECKKNNVVFRLGSVSGRNFSTFKELKETAENYNHKVLKVEKLEGLHTVYNITVDDFHTVGIVTNQYTNKSGNTNYNGIFVANCGEQPLGLDTCRLISICLKSYVEDKFKDSAHFQFDNFATDVKIMTRLADNMVDLEIEKIQNLIKISNDQSEKDMWNTYLNSATLGRRVGLGTHGLADCFVGLKVHYDSEDALKITHKIYETLKLSAYQESVNLAKERGAFPVFGWEVEQNNDYIKSLPFQLRADISRHGRRNMVLLNNAPGGSIAIESRCNSGFEPFFRLLYKRRKKVNHTESADVKFVDALGDQWEEYDVLQPSLKEYQELFDTLDIPDYFVTSDKIDWDRKIELQAIIQKHVDGSLSNTLNLPRGTKPEIVGNLYFKAWKLGLKGVTVYVEGSRDGVLISNDEKSSKVEKFEYRDSFKRTESLKCDIHYSNTKDLRWVIIVGLIDDKPYEVFGGFSNDLNIPEKYKVGILKKRTYKTKKSEYDLILENDEIIENVGECFNSFNFADHTRLISLSLRHGAKPSFVAEQLAKNQGDMFSFSKVISRVLKKYVEDGTKPGTEKACQDCKQDTLVYQDGCVICTNCGYSKCS